MKKVIKILAFIVIAMVAETSYAQATMGLIIDTSDQKIQLSAGTNKIQVGDDGYFYGNIESGDIISITIGIDRKETLDVGILVPGEIYKYEFDAIILFLMQETGEFSFASFKGLKKLWCCTSRTPNECKKNKEELMNPPKPCKEEDIKQIIVPDK